MERLKDIKPLVSVPDNSLLLVVLIMIGVLVIAGALFAWLKMPRRKRRKKLSPKERALQNLCAIDFNDTKESVYAFSEDMHILVPEHLEEDFKKLLERLALYKYKKSVPSLSKEDKEAMEKMIEEVKNV